MLAFCGGEHASGGADGADARGADGAADPQTFLRPPAPEHAGHVPGGEGIAAAGAVDERHGIGAGA